MRKLTIERKNKVGGNRKSIRIYVWDENAPDKVIDGVPCRYIGELGNGEKRTFEITEEETEVYAVSETMTGTEKHEVYHLSPSSYDSTITLKSAGVALPGRKKKRSGSLGESLDYFRESFADNRKLSIVMAITMAFAMIVGAIIGVNIADKRQKRPADAFENGIGITVTQQFVILRGEDADLALKSANMTILAHHADLTPETEGLTEAEYAREMIAGIGVESTVEETAEGIRFVYDGVTEDYEYYRSYTYVKKANGAFWWVDFRVAPEKAERFESDIVAFAGTIRFTE